jgi:MATE family multidrug resistance protein
VILAFPMELEGTGIWLGLAAGLAAVSFMMIGRWLRRERLGLDRPR